MDEVNIAKEENNNINPIPPTNHYQKNNDIVFLPSRFNEEAPTKFKILLFLIGFLGLQLVGGVFGAILLLTTKNELLSNSLSNLVGYLAVFVFFIIFLKTSESGKYGNIILSGFKKKKNYIWSALLLGLALLIETILSLINTSVLSLFKDPGPVTSLNEQTINDILDSQYALLMIFPIIIFAPVIEEFTYRLGLVDTIGKRKRIRGLILSSIIFGFLHFNGILYLLYMAFFPIFSELGILEADVTMYSLLYDFIAEVLNLPIYILMGACLGLAYLITGDISTSIVAHSTNNLLSVVVFYVSKLPTAAYIVPGFVVRLANLSLSPYTSSFFSFIAK